MRLAALASHWHFESSRAEKFVNIASPAKVASLRVRLLCNARGIVYRLGCSFVGLYVLSAAGSKSHLMWKTITV
jgi:hypothetical protein